MINSVSNQKISFSGKSFRAPKGFSDDFERFECKNSKVDKDFGLPYMPVQQTFEQVKLEKKPFGYAAPGAKPLEKYSGPVGEAEGFSTESGGYGGGWLKAHMDTPLSTRDVHTCAAVHLVNEQTGEHCLYHVYHGTGGINVKKFLEEKFPHFDKVNIVSGDAPQTNNTNNATNAILYAVNSLNKKADVNFYHFPVKAPEIVAHQDKVYYLPSKEDGSMSFKEVKQYAPIY